MCVKHRREKKLVAYLLAFRLRDGLHPFSILPFAFWRICAVNLYVSVFVFDLNILSDLVCFICFKAKKLSYSEFVEVEKKSTHNIEKFTRPERRHDEPNRAKMKQIKNKKLETMHTTLSLID